METIEGFLLVNKPEGITSFDCIKKLKKIIRQKIKIGHARTLDPFAKGLLIVALGRTCTKHLSYFQGLPKRYEATAHVGLLTTTFDKTGSVISHEPSQRLEFESLKEAAKKFIGGYVQTPPAFSALKYQGRSLHKYARKKTLSEETINAILESKKRFVSIYDLIIEGSKGPFFCFSTTVSKGTYVRMLAHDIALSLGHPATTVTLKRTNIGPYDLKDALLLTPTTTLQDIFHSLLPIGKMKNKHPEPFRAIEPGVDMASSQV